MRKNPRLGVFEIPIEDMVNSWINNTIDDGSITFGDIMEFALAAKREIPIVQDINEGMGNSVDAMIRFWNSIDESMEVPVEKRVPIRVIINTDGGDLNESFIMYDSISMSKTPVHTYAVGKCYSGGFLTFLGGQKRFCYPHASFLFHEGGGGMYNDSTRLRNWSDFHQKQIGMLKDITLSRTGIDEDKYREINREDFWLTAPEAVAYGVVDEIIDRVAN